MPLQFMRLLYSGLFCLALPLVLFRLRVRARRAPAYALRWQERLGYGYQEAVRDPHRQLVWLHAVSVGETEAAVPLVKKLLEREDLPQVLVTTTTPTGSERVQKLLGDSVLHVYLPYDIPVILNRFFDHFRPDLAIIMETEIWPNLFHACGSRAISLVMANARLSARSLRGYARLGNLVRATLGHVTCLAAQTDEDAERFASLGASPAALHVTGNIKFDLSISAEQIMQGQSLKAELFSGRPVWVAASTHAGEDEVLLQVHLELLETLPDLVLVLVPRHPERFSDVEGLVRQLGCAMVKRTDSLPCTAGDSVFVLDTMGELRTFYAAADVAVVGGSLVEVGGHNVLEPAAVGIPVLFGPYMHNFRLIAERLLQANGAVQVAEVAELVAWLLRFFLEADLRKKTGNAGRGFVESNRGALGRLYKLLPVTASSSS